MSGAATAIGIGTAIGGIGSIASGAMGASAAGKAADTQASAADRAAQLQYKASQDALDFQKQQWDTTQKNAQPWLNAGTGALAKLNTGTAPGGSLVTPYGKEFQAPTGLDMTNDPGYMERLKLGTDAIQRSAAARGGVVTGGTAKALNQFGQDYASNEYSNVYNRALQGYNPNFKTYNVGQTNHFNRLAALAGVGQTAATNLANQGQAASNNVTGTLLGTAAQQGQDYANAAGATASGYINSANAWGGGLQGATGILNQGIYQNNQLNQLTQLQKLLLQGSGSGYRTPYTNELGDQIG